MAAEAQNLSHTGFITGTTLPAPIRRNAFKAFGRLFTAAIEIPAAYLEGKVEEKHAETQGRVKIISTAAQQIAEEMKVDPEYARVAVRKFGEKVVRERINLDNVVKVAAEQICQDVAMGQVKSETEIAEINDDWLNHFEKEASQKSTEEMQEMFGRILAGEIQRPSSFSIKTMKLVAELDSRVALLFRKACSLSICLQVAEHVIDSRVASLGGHAGDNALAPYGLGFGELNVLQEFGLIIADYHCRADYRCSVVDQESKSLQIPFFHQNRPWGLVSTSEADSEAPEELRVHGVGFSRSGKELMKIVIKEPCENYTEALKEYFKGLNYLMVPVKPKG